jgi:D-alanyl-D-alanine carboxypeptidase
MRGKIIRFLQIGAAVIIGLEIGLIGGLGVTKFQAEQSQQALAGQLQSQHKVLAKSEVIESLELDSSTPTALKEEINLVSPALAKNRSLPAGSSAQVVVATCSDCTLYYVDKTHALPSSYVPKVVPTGLAGGGSLTSQTVEALKQLFASANSKGLKPRVNSSYRSYSQQLSTYNYWVQGELNRGKSRAEAELAANRYSAKPGHSEHQLGTTADINCQDCQAFDRNNKANNAIWKFLEENAHKYGFVISYPRNMEAVTGYVYEPWHIRYVGVELASEIHSKGYVNGNGIYLAQFLRQKNLAR